MSDHQEALKHAIEIRLLDFFYGKFQGLKDINLNIVARVFFRDKTVKS